MEKFGRPLAFYTDKAGMFQVAVKTKRGEQREGRERKEMPPTQIAHALGELGIVWIPAHSAEAKGRVERQFLTAQDRLVKGLRVAGVCTIEAANAYLQKRFLPWWNRTLTVKPAQADDAHRPLTKEHDLGAILSHVEKRQLDNGYVLQYDAKFYRVHGEDVRPGMRKAWVRVEQRLDGKIAVRHEGRCVWVSRCPQPERQSGKAPAGKLPTQKAKPKRKNNWMENFSIRSGPSLRAAIGISNARD